MFKKFQDLFFEEDDDEIEEEEEVIEVQPKRRSEKPAEEAPAEKPAMKRIDVTTEMPKAKPVKKEETPVDAAVMASVPAANASSGLKA